MKIIAYRTQTYKNIDTFETDEIFGNVEPDEMTDEFREQLRKGDAEPMCCFNEEDGTMHCIPWQFIISIT